MPNHQNIMSAKHQQPVSITAPALPGANADALEVALADMSAALSSDFSNGRVGERHNTYQHRTRVLRRMTEELAAMRVSDALAAE
ncbi:MAG: hypothetical protein K2X73_13450 [Sphingomonas sp.]|uniref:hypothetical protein n=1 Tax=Sphingomonas sp. TaxID=28214 RepID=UPI0025EC6DDD|nr:hypothetical protein [Sphingomonas sp.]MBX9882965.1 hypothetical protein [Sphingomonas sp.]